MRTSPAAWLLKTTSAMMPMMSFGLAMAAYTAQNYGAQKYSRIAEGVRKCTYMSVAFSIFAGILLIIFKQHIRAGKHQHLVLICREHQGVIAAQV